MKKKDPKIIQKKGRNGSRDGSKFPGTQAEHTPEKVTSKSPFDKYDGYLADKKGQDPDASIETMRGR